jgi:hypothetical protein
MDYRYKSKMYETHEESAFKNIFGNNIYVSVYTTAQNYFLHVLLIKIWRHLLFQ